MTVETKWGWIGGAGSLADDIPEQLWRGELSLPPNVTDGPLTYLKSAAIIGNENNFESSIAPGENRTIQQATVQTAAFSNQTPEGARQRATDDTPQKPTKAPDKGQRGAEVIRLVRQRLRQDAKPGVETGTQTVAGAEAPKHNLRTREPAPVPKELDPNARIGNLGDYHERSAWTSSGPQAALHENYSKVGSLLAFAGVPGAPGPESLLAQLALQAAELEKRAGAEYLTRTDVHPLKLAAELSDTLGDEWLQWEPETIRETLIKNAGVEPSDDVMSKIMAVKIVMHRPDLFYDDWHALEKIAVALNDQSPLMGQVEDVPVEWLSNAVAIVSKLAGAGDFGPETTKYVAARLREQGYVVAPPLLRFADDELGAAVQDDELRKKVILAYAQAVKAQDINDGGDDPVSIQVNRLLRNNAYVLDRLGESRSQLAG